MYSCPVIMTLGNYWKKIIKNDKVDLNNATRNNSIF